MAGPKNLTEEFIAYRVRVDLGKSIGKHYFPLPAEPEFSGRGAQSLVPSTELKSNCSLGTRPRCWPSSRSTAAQHDSRCPSDLNMCVRAFIDYFRLSRPAIGRHLGRWQ